MPHLLFLYVSVSFSVITNHKILKKRVTIDIDGDFAIKISTLIYNVQCLITKSSLLVDFQWGGMSSVLHGSPGFGYCPSIVGESNST